MTLQQFHNSSCCHHQQNNGLCNWHSTSTYAPPPSTSSMEVLQHMDSLSLSPTPNFHQLNVSSSSHSAYNNDDDYYSNNNTIINIPAAKSIENGFGENNGAVSMEDIVMRRKIYSMNHEDHGQDVVMGPSKLCARGHWKPAEDSKLKELVALYGPQNWNLIAEKLQGRTGKSCRLRWFNQLDPRINKKAFTEEEEERLMAAHRAYGNKWAMIARLFPGRTDNAVKNHWHVIMARKYREQATAYRRRKLTQVVQTKLEDNNNYGIGNLDGCREEADCNLFMPNNYSPNNNNNILGKLGAAFGGGDLFLGSKSNNNSFSQDEGEQATCCRNQTQQLPLVFFSDFRSQSFSSWNSSGSSRQYWKMLKQDETRLSNDSQNSKMLMQLSDVSESIASASDQITAGTEPSSSSSPSAGTHFETSLTTSSPPFIDFLGVGAS
ncbi:hypothetical protein COLO4_10323 [Corchorus olitorius]|uniref:SANT/Myb domain-containing protein n=1 Tax=Corchorus olitorius TaxID=93759 RepID=A0A1R3K932_9ROSI|nr:hypothetical protein COLO4_10323 [Corchorus olitorius]